MCLSLCVCFLITQLCPYINLEHAINDFFCLRTNGAGREQGGRGGARIDKGQREDMGKREKEGMGGAGKTELCMRKGQGNIGFTSAWERWNRKGDIELLNFVGK